MLRSGGVPMWRVCEVQETGLDARAPEGEEKVIEEGKDIRVGHVREQCVWCDSQRPVILVSNDGSHNGLRIVAVYPDTVDADGRRIPTFKIKIVRISAPHIPE